MVVVADSSPLIVLIKIECIEILHELFGTVIIPTAVADELRDEARPQMIRDFIGSPPSWLIERSPISFESIPKLHAGEIAAICLARELNADLLLIDEFEGRRAAVHRNLKITGTVGILERAAHRGLVDLQQAYERIKNTNFWINAALLDQSLKQFESPPDDITR